MAKSKETQIKELLGRLEKSKDQAESRSIRKKLRGLGHKGGLNKPQGQHLKKKGKRKKKVKKAKKVKKIKRAAAADKILLLRKAKRAAAEEIAESAAEA